MSTTGPPPAPLPPPPPPPSPSANLHQPEPHPHQTIQQDETDSNPFARIKLKPTVTTERKLDTRRINVLLITKNWTVYSWLSPDIKLVLITTVQAEEERQKYGSDKAKKAYSHVEVLESDLYDGGYVEWTALQLHKTYRFTHVIVLSESDLIRAGRIRKLLGLTTGQSTENALRYRDKVLMKSVVSQHGLKVPTFAAVESAADVISFVREHGYPVVVKPKLGYSSVNTTVIKSETELLSFVKNGLKSAGIDPIYGLEVEKFVNGPMYHVDGMVIDGQLVVSWPSKYIGTVVEFRKNRYIAGYGLPRDDPVVKRINEYTEAVIKALGSAPHPNPSSFPFHAEVWHTPEDDIVLCEIASRGGGGNIKKEINELFHINLDEIWVQSQCNDVFPDEFEEDLKKYKTWHNFFPKPSHLVAWSYIYPKTGTVMSFPSKTAEGTIPNLPSYCIHWQTFLEIGQQFKGPQDCADTVVACLVTGNTESELHQHLEGICDWFFENSVWKE